MTALSGSPSPNFSLLKVHPVPQDMTRQQAISHVRSSWYKIPKSQYDPSYEMLGLQVLLQLTQDEITAYNDNLCLRRDICMDENSVRYHNRLRLDFYAKGDSSAGHENYKRMRLCKRVAQQKRISLLTTPFLKSSGWFYTK
jgi:hypothetical protein